jgi:hypothetical protein
LATSVTGFKSLSENTGEPPEALEMENERLTRVAMRLNLAGGASIEVIAQRAWVILVGSDETFTDSLTDFDITSMFAACKLYASWKLLNKFRTASTCDNSTTWSAYW